MNIKKAYYYLFYKLYKFSEAAPSKWLSQWKASLSIDVLVGILFFTIGIYYTTITKKDFIFFSSNILLWILVIIIAISNYVIFNHNDRWKNIVEEFDQLPKRKNKIGTVIVWSIIFFIIANLIFSFYLMSQIDWKQHR